ncbi:MAG TPA: hypothetical protein VFW52_01570 [Candidatus Saccharimonadales bacterium]|nr:hypothetical protein [Candidatus Saccharimonadales bacterium]
MSINTVLKSAGAGIVSVVLTFMMPFAIVAAQTADTATTSGSPITGPVQPSGADAKTYTYNPDTGLWENAYYTWDPVTKQTAPKTQQDYSYNPDTGRWDTTKYVYDAAAGKYIPNTVSVTKDQVPADQLLKAQTQTAPKSDTASGSSTGTYDKFYNAEISNKITSDATSGDATVSKNTTGGSAASGDANAILNLINLLQTSTGALQDNGFSVFNSNVYGNVQGDLMIDPSQILAKSDKPSNLTVNAQNSGSINNDVDLSAKTGSASVDSNTSAGNAASGNAAAVANIVNVINSVIGSGQSFLGAVNIYGSLDGDILLPPDVLQTLLANNGGSSATTTPVKVDSNANIANNQSINNLVDLSAASGLADVSHNTSAGNATTGSTQTNLTILNLVGSQIAGKDVLLVFVNVMGKWVGVLYSAPQGSTAAAIGGGITGNTSTPVNSDVEATTNQSINNNIKLAAASGDASVTNNTTAGNATSGDAMAAANILNILNSTFSLADWFGVLFINVFGTWNGSFGINTAAGNPAHTGGGSNTSSSSGAESVVKGVKVFRFVPASSDSGNTNSTKFKLASMAAATDNGGGSGSQSSKFPLFGASTSGSGPANPVSGSHLNFLFPVIGGIIGASLLGADKAIKKREELQSLRAFSRIVFHGKI